MLLGVLLAVLVLYGLLLFWVLNERLKEVHHLLRSLLKRIERMEKGAQRRERGEEEEGVTEERFPLYMLESETSKKEGE
ncbi:MAG: hypothetical protein H5U36_00955 [Candidatus Caldatribacterium sp.]|nr:hypothetical protein [Candidatus Caldatribacterium sp.]